MNHCYRFTAVQQLQIVFTTSKVTELVCKIVLFFFFVCFFVVHNHVLLIAIEPIQSFMEIILLISLQRLDNNYTEPENCTAPPTTTTPPSLMTTNRITVGPNSPTSKAMQPLSKCGILFLLHFIISVLLIFG